MNTEEQSILADLASFDPTRSYCIQTNHWSHAPFRGERSCPVVHHVDAVPGAPGQSCAQVYVPEEAPDLRAAANMLKVVLQPYQMPPFVLLP